MKEVTRDLFCIAKRLKHINKDYRVFYNDKAARFEVHTKQLEFVVPYDRLDARTLEHARRTRKQNDAQIEAEITKHNNDIQTSAQKKMNGLRRDLEDKLTYAMRAGHEVNFTKDYVKEF